MMSTVYVVGKAGDRSSSIEKVCGAIGCKLLAVSPGTPEYDLLKSRQALDSSVLGIFFDGEIDAEIQQADFTRDIFVAAIPEPGDKFDFQVLSILAAQMEKNCSTMQLLYVESARVTSRMRDLLRETEANFDLLEKYVRSHGLMQPQTRLWAQPGFNGLVLGSKDVVVQPLPHNSHGLCYISFYLAKPLGKRSKILVTLKTGTGETVCEWEVIGPQRAGAVNLTLSKPLEEQARQLTLCLQGFPTFGSSVNVALAANPMTKRWSAKRNQADLDFPIAIALQFVPPGVRLPRRQNEILARDRTAEAEEISDTLIVVEDWALAEFKKGPVPEDWLVSSQGDGTLQTHPYADGVTVAYLEDVDLADWPRLRAEITLAHENAPKVGFALAVVKAGAKAPPKFSDNTLKWADFTTGWVELTGGERNLLALEFDAPLEKASIYLLTELRETRSDYAWARWGQLFLER